MCHNSKALSLHYRPSDDEVALARMLDKVLRRSDALDKESLCIIAGQRVSFFFQRFSLQHRIMAWHCACLHIT
jgi:hypothetical protein